MRYATWSVQHDREMRKKLRLSQRILSAIMTPVMVFSMTGMNFSVAGLMTAHAEDAIVATDTVTTPASTPAPATVEAPKVDIPKVDPTPAPVIPKVETPAPASVVDPAPKAADPVVAPVTDPTPTPAPTVDSTPAPDSDSTPAIVPATTVPTTPTVDAAGEATTERVIPEWVADGNKQTTGSSVVLGKKYVAPQNDQVTVTFTKLPENAGKLSIEEITLTPEQVASLHALSNKAYDITSDMADGTFAYTMTLPKPKDQKNVQIKYAEDTAGLANAETVASGDVTTKTNSVSAELDHFTTFVVTVTSGASIDVTKIERGAINPTMNVTLAGDTFVGTIDSPNTDSWTISSGTTTLHDPVVTITSSTTATVAFTGTTALGSISIKANSAAVKAGGDINAVIVDVADTIAPAETSVTLNQTAKTITTVFSEVVHLVNDDYSAHPTLTKDDLGIYAYTAGSWHNVDVVSISAVTLVDKVLTVTYTGTLPIGTYIIDTYGTKVVDASGNEMVDAGALTFDATGVIDTPSIAGVTAPVTDAIPTSTITATDLYTATISWSGAPVTFHPGTAYTATITITPKSGYTLTGVTSDYFTVAGATATNSANSGVISAVFPTTATKQLTIADPSSLTLSKTYDGTTTAAVTAGALSGVVSGDAVTVSAVATYNSKDFGTGKTITVEYTLSGNDAAKYIKPVNYTIATGIITQATSTTEVTCPTDSQTYTGSAITPCTVSVTGAGGLNLTPDPTYASNTVVGTASASYTYAGDANHSGSGDSKNFDITAKHITGTFTASNKVYDGNDSATVTGRALVGAVVGDVVSLSGGTATFNNVNVADGKTVTLTGATLAGAAAVNYTLDSVATTTANITQANLTITADDISKAHGATDPTLTASYDGFVNSETESVLDTPVTLTRDAGEAVGSYTITAHGAADANYNIAYVDGTFSIGQTTPDGDGNATLDNSNPQVVITDGSQAVTLEITNGTTDPSIDVSGLLGGGVSGTLPEITINAGVASVVIPDGTIVTGPAGWDGVIGGPAAGSSNGDSAPSGFAVGGTVISVGSPDKTLTFSVPVVITLPGVTGTVGYRPAGSTQWHEITNVCTGTYESPTGAPAGGECAISNGTDTKILTYHFTSFGNLLDTQAPDAVTSLKAKYGPKTDGKVEVTWHAKDSDISKTLVYRGETKHFTMNWDSRVAKQNKSDESYIDKNVEPGKTYYYKVVTEDAAGNQSDAEVIKIVIPEGDVAATGVLQGTEPAPNDKADKSGTVGTGTASDVSGTVSGATTGDQTVTDKGAAVLGADTQAGGFWGSVWMWIIVIGLGAGAVTIFMRRRPKGIA